MGNPGRAQLGRWASQEGRDHNDQRQDEQHDGEDRPSEDNAVDFHWTSMGEDRSLS